MQETQLAAREREELDRAFASFVGMEGGNPAAAIWICDVAPLIASVPLEVALRPQPEPGAWDLAFRRRHARWLPRWQTHLRVARVLAAARAAALHPGRSHVSAQAYFEHYLYRPGGWDFKLNLFPLPERPDPVQSWSKTFRDQPWLRVKSDYARLCRLGGRFRFIASLREQYRPRLVLCLGQRHARDYLRAFGFEGCERAEAWLQPADTMRRLDVYEHGQTALVLSPPFGGPQGLSSDVLLDALGTFLARWLRPEDFPALAGADGSGAGRLPAGPTGPAGT
ncbi:MULTISPECIES: transcriptional regulator [Cupriavidus]|nr:MULTISPECIES: transcriptional regulator [Cupriavidus]